MALVIISGWIPYTMRILNASGNHLVDFWGPNCTPCIGLNKTLELLSEEVGNVSFYKVNADEEIDIAAQAMVRGLPTLILYRDGQETARWTGAFSKEDLSAKIRKAID